MRNFKMWDVGGVGISESQLSKMVPGKRRRLADFHFDCAGPMPLKSSVALIEHVDEYGRQSRRV